MDQKFKNWQQQYQQSTPDVDTSALIKQVSKAQKKEQTKAWLELVLGAGVSLYCIYVALVFAASLLSSALFVALSAVPIGFSLWSFKLKQNNWQQQSVDVNQLLAIKRQQLHTQLRYWRVNAAIVSGLWLALLVFAVFDYAYFDNGSQWLVIVCVNAVVLAATVARFSYLNSKFEQRSNDIAALLEGTRGAE
ncbi:hypothetical protein [Aliiglaciecola sp. LCG003]|uniref:hypothetical protein n=1 Tax=Aliiglaciecola sp. LCG003 TaxID=3053655 RepID=UPI0025739A21|nr:hypothetical protein [Aliiglaciecola sp. LCG003]WJG08906.1 hypothetical protein QR722_16445 [Aliiglaciecola sp. LCG003]